MSVKGATDDCIAFNGNVCQCTIDSNIWSRVIVTYKKKQDNHKQVPGDLLGPLGYFDYGMACRWVIQFIDTVTMASQITSLAVVYSTVYSDADQRKHQSSASLAFVRRIHRDRWIPRTKGQLRGKCFHLVTSSWALTISDGLVPAHTSADTTMTKFGSIYEAGIWRASWYLEAG